MADIIKMLLQANIDVEKSIDKIKLIKNHLK